MSDINTPISFNRQVATELIMFSEMIQEVYSIYEDVKWSNNSHYELGFNYRDKQFKYDVFFGIWYELWEHYEVPLSIIFDYKGSASSQWHDKLKAHINSKGVEGVRVEDFAGFTCILFEYKFFKFDAGDDIERLADLYDLSTKFAETLHAN